MTFVPASSWAPATVAIGGTVDVSDRANRLLGHTNVDNFPAIQPVSGTVTANQGAAGAALWLVDGSGVTQPVSVASLPLPAGAATDAAAQAARRALNELAVTAILERERMNEPPADQLVHLAGPLEVRVDNFPAVQPVSVDALPLPNGAATERSLYEVRRAVNDVAGAAILKDGEAE